MSLRITAVSDEPLYPSSLVPKTLIDIIEVLGKSGCEVCLLQPGSSNWERNEKLFHVITFSRIPKFLTLFPKKLQKSNEPMFKAIAASLNLKVYQTLLSLARSSDVVMCYDLQYSIPALVSAKIAGKPVILLGDILYIGYYRGVRDISSFLLGMLLLWERSVEKLVDRISVWGPDDKDFLIASGIRREKVHVIPLSINLTRIDQMRKTCNSEPAFRKLKSFKEKGFKILMFHGNLNYGPNQSSCEYIVNELAPRLLEKHSNIVFAIVGAGLSAVTDCDERIVFTGRVDNLFSCLDLADIGLVPLTFGSGVKNKVL